KEERFAEYWANVPAPERDDIQMEVVRRTILFEASFPPLRELRRELSPATELSVRAELLGGALVVSGKLDLLLGVPDRLEPMRATRIAIDLKTGNAYPQYAEDNRLYALVLALRFGVPPFRVASFFLEGGTWQAEDVDETTLFHAADRVVEAARSAAALHNGREPALTPGPWCGWGPPLQAFPAGRPRPRASAARRATPMRGRRGRSRPLSGQSALARVPHLAGVASEGSFMGKDVYDIGEL